MSNNRNLAKTIIICLLFASSSLIVLTPNASAHTPAWEIPTFAFINVSPDPVGVGQPVAVVVWLDKILDGT